MKYLLFIMFAVSLSGSVDPATVRKINEAKARAEDAFKSGDYKTAIHEYEYLVDSLGVQEDEVRLNLANAYFLAKDTTNAFSTYQSLTTSTDNTILSKANQQLGVMANQRGKFQEALNYFKQAIKAAPTNDDARYNYEMLKKKLEEQKKQQEKQKQNKDKNQKDQQNQDQQNNDKEKQDQQKDQQKQDQKKQDGKDKDQQQKEQEEKEKQQQEKEQKEQQEKEQQQQDRKGDMQNLDREKLQQMKISEEKARMILEAMKNQEKQYLQQQKRKASRSRDRNKPDW